MRTTLSFLSANQRKTMENSSELRFNLCDYSLFFWLRNRIIIYSFGFTYLLVPERHLKLRRLFILVPVISALILIAQPKENYIKAFEKQVSIWQNNFQSWNILEKGPAAAQVLNTKQTSIEVLTQSQPRLEFHPQNDLLFHYHALGASGLTLRFIIYIVVLSLY